jgi:hypothetical protein
MVGSRNLETEGVKKRKRNREMPSVFRKGEH